MTKERKVRDTSGSDDYQVVPQLDRVLESETRLRRRFNRSTAAHLVLLSLAGLFAGLSWQLPLDIAALAGVVAFIGAAALRANLIISGSENAWHSVRVANESIQSLVWRFSVRANPFSAVQVAEPILAERELKRRIQSLSDSLARPDDFVLPPEEFVTSDLRSIREQPLEERLDTYVSYRLRPAQERFKNQASVIEVKLGRWNILLGCMEVFGTIGAVLRVVGIVQVSLLGLAGTAVAGVGAWMRVRRYKERRGIYLDTLSELNDVADQTLTITSEAAFNGVVDRCEDILVGGATDDPRVLIDVVRRHSFDVEKVSRLDWDHLAPYEREALYEQFIQLRPRTHVSRSPVTGWQRQRTLQTQRAIELGPFVRLAAAAGIDEAQRAPKLPHSPVEHDYFHELADRLLSALPSMLSKPLEEQHVEAIKALHHYLSCRDIEVDRSEEANVDAIVIPGARTALPYRVEEGHRLYSQSDARLMILTGGQPSYEAGEQPVPIAEAEAMEYYLKTKLREDEINPSIVREGRAQNSLETVIHTLPHIRSLSGDLGRQVTVALVTSPYHMRRFLFTFLRAEDTFGGGVARTLPVLASTTIDRSLLVDDSASVERRVFGLSVYIQEYVKLVTGRAIGEL